MNELDVVISSRIRFARNIKDYPFTTALDTTSANEIIEKVEAVLDDFKKTDFIELSYNKARSYAETHIVSNQFVDMQLPHALFEKGDAHIMICEEDHIRLQVIKQGLCLDAAFEEACGIDDRLLSGLRIAYDNELGFLTHCPTNLGTGMRASVMLFLPGLTLSGELNSIVSQLSKLGLTIRGMYGEGSRAQGYIYQISNMETMGVDEASTVEKLKEIVGQIIEYERNARKVYKNGGNKNADPLTRAFGILMYSRVMSFSEFVELYAKVRFGVSIGVIEGIEYNELDELFNAVTPATLMAEQDMTEAERDSVRSTVIQKKLMK